MKSLKSTTLLNELVSDGYLRRTHQGGDSPIALDLNYDEGRDTYEVAPFGVPSKLQTMAFDILDREEIPGTYLDGVDMSDFNEVISAVNNAVGRTVLVVVSEPSQYRIREEAIDEVLTKVEAAEDEEK